MLDGAGSVNTADGSHPFSCFDKDLCGSGASRRRLDSRPHDRPLEHLGRPESIHNLRDCSSVAVQVDAQKGQFCLSVTERALTGTTTCLPGETILCRMAYPGVRPTVDTDGPVSAFTPVFLGCARRVLGKMGPRTVIQKACIDNINDLLGEYIKKSVQPGARLKIAASCFSIYAFEALKRELESVESFEFIFTSPSFMPDEMTDAAKKEAMQRHVNGIGHGGRCTGLLPTHSSVGCSGVVLTSVALHRHRSPTSPLSTKNSRIHHDRQLMNTGLHAIERTLTGPCVGQGSFCARGIKCSIIKGLLKAKIS